MIARLQRVLPILLILLLAGPATALTWQDGTITEEFDSGALSDWTVDAKYVQIGERSGSHVAFIHPYDYLEQPQGIASGYPIIDMSRDFQLQFSWTGERMSLAETGPKLGVINESRRYYGKGSIGVIFSQQDLGKGVVGKFGGIRYSLGEIDAYAPHTIKIVKSGSMADLYFDGEKVMTRAVWSQGRFRLHIGAYEDFTLSSVSITYPGADRDDPDSDTLPTFQEEIAVGTDPSLADTDGDGIPDNIEHRYSLSPTQPYETGAVNTSVSLHWTGCVGGDTFTLTVKGDDARATQSGRQLAVAPWSVVNNTLLRTFVFKTPAVRMPSVVSEETLDDMETGTVQHRNLSEVTVLKSTYRTDNDFPENVENVVVHERTGIILSVSGNTGCADRPLLSLRSVGGDDGDDLSGMRELLVTGTNPASSDTDGDGLDDGIEVSQGYDPVTVTNDSDGIPPGREEELGTRPDEADTDGDGMPDDVEVSGATSPIEADTDGDVLGDAIDPAPTSVWLPLGIIPVVAILLIAASPFLLRRWAWRQASNTAEAVARSGPEALEHPNASLGDIMRLLEREETQDSALDALHRIAEEAPRKLPEDLQSIAGIVEESTGERREKGLEILESAAEVFPSRVKDTSINFAELLGDEQG